MHWKPEITVAAVVQRNGRFLIVEERIGRRRVFNQPAGHVEHGEDLLGAVVRETLEETAWHFEPRCLLGVYRWRAARSAHGTLRFAFTGRLVRHEAQRELDSPVLAVHWLTRPELLARARALRTSLVMQCVDDYLAGRRLPLSAVAT